jgi:ketosteroid isomerase-like protein
VDLADRIRVGFERFNRRDWAGVSRGLPDDFEAVDHVPPDELRAHGPDALRQITDANGDTAFADLRMQVLEVSIVGEDGDLVRAAVRVWAAGSGGSSGAPVEAEIAQLWTFRDGIAVRMEQFRTWEEALAAAGRG